MQKLPMPSDLRVGIKVVSLRDTKCHATQQEKCVKCDGSGKWRNPRNEFDTRECFACRGYGVHSAKVRGANGKPTWRKLPAGTTGEVVDWTSFGTFYHNGYNHPNRSNTNVKVRTAEGEILSFTLEALSLA